MRKFLRELWAVLVERCKVHRALRILNKQEWSIEFLQAMLIRSAKTLRTPLEMTINGPNGYSYTVRVKPDQEVKYKDENIFDNLDNEAAIRQFMENLNRL